MFIIKFNKMVKNKIVWFAFAIVVAVAFGASDILWSAGRSRETVGEYGLLDGKPVDPTLFSIATHMVRFANRRDGVSDAEEIRPVEVWKRIAAIKAADAAGIAVSDAELATIIRSMPDFKGQNGTFDNRRYVSLLRDMDLTPVLFQEVIRSELKLDFLRSVVAVGAFVPPSIAADRAHGVTDDYVLASAVLSNRHSVATVQVSDEEAKAFYESHKSLYVQPEKRQVAYVTFRASDFLGEASVSEEDVVAYYDEHESSFLEKGTNGVEEVKPLERVRGEIEKTLADEAARELAYAAAGRVADRFFEASEREAEALDFATEVVKLGGTVRTSDLFTAESHPVLFSASSVFVESVFDLSMDSMRARVSDAIGGGEESYVACLLTNIEEHVAAYADVASKVVDNAKAARAEVAFQEDIVRVREALEKSLEENKTFEEAVASEGLLANTNVVFSFMAAYGKEPPLPSPRQVARAMTQLGTGDLCKEAVPVPEGALFFRVLERRPGDALLYGQGVRQMSLEMASNLTEATWADWLEKNLFSMNPEPREPFDAFEPAEDEEE